MRRFATEQIGPLVRKMDEESKMDPAMIRGLFENGVSGGFELVVSGAWAHSFGALWPSVLGRRSASGIGLLGLSLIHI